MMNNSLKKLLSMILCVVLVAAMALFATGCMENGKPEEPKDAAESVSFTVIVVDLEGKETTYEVTTTAATVGEALLAEELIAGEEGPYGLYIKEVTGIPLDWDTHGKYWAFYIDGEMALTGVDSTDVAEGAVYTFKPE